MLSAPTMRFSATLMRSHGGHISELLEDPLPRCLCSADRGVSRCTLDVQQALSALEHFTAVGGSQGGGSVVHAGAGGRT